MPSTSEKQAKLMRAVAHGWKKPGGGGPSVSVAKEFSAADKGKKKFGGTKQKINKQDTRHGKMDMPYTSLNKYAGKAAGGEVMAKGSYASKEKRHAATLRKIAAEEEAEGGMKKGGKVKKCARGGGIEIRGKTRGKFV